MQFEANELGSNDPSALFNMYNLSREKKGTRVEGNVEVAVTACV